MIKPKRRRLIKKQCPDNTGLFFLIFSHVCWGRRGKKSSIKKYYIDYFGYAVNLEFKFKLNFDEEGGQK